MKMDKALIMMISFFIQESMKKVLKDVALNAIF